MAYGWERGFVIDYPRAKHKKKSCLDCYYADRRDRSCNKRPIIFREDGYEHWKNCKYYKHR